MYLYNRVDCLGLGNYKKYVSEKHTLKIQIFEEVTSGVDRIVVQLHNSTPSQVGSVEIYTVPFCCGDLFVGNLHSYVYRKGNARQLLGIVKRFAKLGNYSRVLCVIPQHKDYKPAVNLFESCGFIPLKESDVVNVRTGNTLRTYLYKVNEQ